MEQSFWDYWRQRWPSSNCNKKVLTLSANFRETRAAFNAGWLAKENNMDHAKSCQTNEHEKIIDRTPSGQTVKEK